MFYTNKICDTKIIEEYEVKYLAVTLDQSIELALPILQIF